MAGNGMFEIFIGEQWNDDLFGNQKLISGEDGFDPAGVRGVFDMFVDGNSLFHHPNEDTIFFLMRDLLSGAEKLSIGDSTARISFYETPYELILQRIGCKVFITFYRGGQRPEVMVKDQTVEYKHFLNGVIESSKKLSKQAIAYKDGANRDPLISWMDKITNKLEIIAEQTSEVKPVVIKRTIVESSRWEKPRNNKGYSFGFKFLATGTDLLASGGLINNDLNALLFRGQFVVHVRERRRVLGEGFLFLQVEKLLASVKTLLTAWEEGRPISNRLISEGIVIDMKLASDDSLNITLMNRTDEDSLVVLNDITPWEYTDAVLGVAREVRRLIVEQSSIQRRNLRLEYFSHKIKTMVAWSKEQRREALINKDIDRYKNSDVKISTSVNRSEIVNSSRIVFKEKWRLEVDGLDLSSTMLCGEVALISAKNFLVCVEIATGEALWKKEVDRSEVRIQVAGRDGFVRVSQTGRVDLVDLRTGSVRWTTQLAPRSGGSPVVLVVDHGSVPGVVIVAEEEKKLIALDLRTGEPVWRFITPRGGRFALRRNGRLLYVSSSDAQFCAIDIETGLLVWLFPERTNFNLPPAIDGDIIVVPGGRYGKYEGRVYGIDAYSGENKWETSLEGSAITAPIVADGVALLPVKTAKSSELVAIDTKTGKINWRIPCDGWAESCALIAIDDKFILNLAGGNLRALSAKTGENAWSTVLGPTCSNDIPTGLTMSLRGGVLFVPGDTIYIVKPENGHVIHSLGGDPPVPDLLQVNPDFSVFIVEESGHIAMYEITRRFHVLQGGA